MRQPKSLLNVFLATFFGCIALACSGALEGKAEVEIEVSLKERYLWLKNSGNVIKRYPIAIGAPESPTIPGVYNILKKVKDPTYYSKSHHKVFPAGPNDPVGVRFMPYLKSATDGKVYAVHGTAWPRWVHLRAAASLGCIRMLNSDVIEVFNQVEVGTPVVIR
ncbi:MAG: TonB-dependent receptor [Spirochaeta sp.]|nr:TonB-dependent receptor [Spirochaeta sp.]